YISGAPIKGTNNTATNAIALGVGAGAVGAQTNSYGLYVNAQTGATNNYVATFMGGRVGIATATPAYLLDIASSGSGVVDTNLRLKNVNSTNNSGAGLALDGYYAGALLRGYTPNAAGFTGGQFDIQVNNDSNVLTTALTINKTGNVGIGTTGPLAKLDVRGLTFGVNHGANVFALSSSGTNYGFIQNDANDVWSLGTGTDLATLGTPVLTWTKAGNVGIGTPSPTSLLHLLGSQPAAVATAGTAATQALQITGGKGGNTTGTTGQTAGAGALVNITSGAGGDAPVGSTNGTGGAITLQGGAPGSGLGNVGSYGNVVLQATGGNVGVGVTPSNFKLELAGHFGPSVDNTYDIGSATYRFRKGFFGNDVTVGGSLTIQGSLATVSNGQVLITGVPTGTAINQGSVYLNPPSAGTNNVLLGIAVNGTEKARIDAEGDLQVVGVFNSTSTSGTNQLSGNLSVLGNTTLGDATSDTLTVTARVSSHLNPSADNTYDLGTASLRWGNFYATNATFNAISTVGTSDADFVINSDNATADTENATLQFERGTLSPNAILKWDSTNDRFEFNDFAVKMLNNLTVAGTGTSSFAGLLQLTGAPVGTGLGQGSLYINPASASTNNTLIGVGVAGVERFKVDAEGDTTIQASLGVENEIYDISQDTLVVNDKLQVNGNSIKDSTGTERIALGSTNTITGALNQVGNLTLIKSGTATAVTQYPSYNLVFQGSGWNTTTVAEVSVAQTLKNIVGSGATGAIPNRLALLNDAGTEYVSFNGVNQSVGIGTTTPTTFKLEVAGSIGPEADN
ncbi:MAG: hypothetical protein AAB948_04215, partial [Patescibacteria group bacterium]